MRLLPVLASLLLAAPTVAASAASFASTQPQPEPQPQQDKQTDRALLTVSGEGEVSQRPDRAVVELGAIAQAKNAAEAQSQVNEVMQRTVEAIRELEIEGLMIQTSGLSISPVYSNRQPQRNQEYQEPEIVGYRASNTVRVRIDDIDRTGDVVDAGIEAGANQFQGISFELKDDAPQRRDALRAAVQDAQQKARVLAEALGVSIDGIEQVNEGGIGPVYRERAMMSRASFDSGAVVEPGELSVRASVSITYRLRQQR